jgi:TRAP transporter TAXI family solute receptor
MGEMPMKASLLACALATGLAAAGPAQAAELKMMTGPQGGAWVPLGGQLKDMWEKAIPGLSVQALPGAGIANVRGVEEGKADVGFGNSVSTVDALVGNEPFKKPHKNVCNVANFYPQYFQLVVRADAGVDSVKDLKGKGVSTQQRGNTGEQITAQVLKANGLSYNDVKMSFGSYTDSVTQLQDGNAVAFGLGTTIPSGAVMDLAASRPIKLLDLTSSLAELRKLNPGYYNQVLIVPAGTYPKQDKDVPVIGYATHIVVSCKLPEDTVYAMTKAIAQNVASLGLIVKPMSKLTPKEMAADIGVPFHPGAAKFYKEAGVQLKM